MISLAPWLLGLAPALLVAPHFAPHLAPQFAPLALPAVATPRVAALVATPQALRLHSRDFSVAELQQAAALWRAGCARHGSAALPELRLGGPGVPVVVRRRADSSSPNGRCGHTRLRIVRGRLESAEIEVFMRQRDGTSCFPLGEEIAHELGHVMGLADRPRGDHRAIMGPRLPGGRRQPSAGECSAVALPGEGSGGDQLAQRPRGPALAPLAAPATSETQRR